MNNRTLNEGVESVTDERINRLSDQIASVSSPLTGFVLDVADLLAYIKQLRTVNRELRTILINKGGDAVCEIVRQRDKITELETANQGLRTVASLHEKGERDNELLRQRIAELEAANRELQQQMKCTCKIGLLPCPKHGWFSK